MIVNAFGTSNFPLETSNFDSGINEEHLSMAVGKLEKKQNTLIDLVNNLNDKVNKHDRLFYRINEVIRRVKEPILNLFKESMGIYRRLLFKNIFRMDDSSDLFFSKLTDIRFLENDDDSNIFKFEKNQY